MGLDDPVSDCHCVRVTVGTPCYIGSHGTQLACLPGPVGTAPVLTVTLLTSLPAEHEDLPVSCVKVSQEAHACHATWL
jgi:hypothetical protein